MSIMLNCAFEGREQVLDMLVEVDSEKLLKCLGQLCVGVRTFS